MIVKNEEDTLPNCLNSAGDIFDEIIIVDTGSHDNTVAIARSFTDKIFYYEWQDDFAAARNFSFAQSASDYVMWLDADDILLPEDAAKLKTLKLQLNGVIQEIAAKYNVGFDAEGNVTLEYYRERIFINNGDYKWSGKVHETIPIRNDCFYADFAVTHNKIHPTERGRNLRIYEKMLASGEVLDARNSFYYARELYYNARYDDAITEFNKFLDSGLGYVENNIDACAVLSECLRAVGQKPLAPLLRSFEYAEPRSEICCEIGRYFYETGKNKEAIYWYETALGRVPDVRNGAFIQSDCSDFIPLLQLCVLYYAEGRTKDAIECNEKAAAIKPNNAAVIYNRNFFKGIK